MPRVDSTLKTVRARHEQANRDALAAVFDDIARDVRARHESGARRLLAARWDDVLAEVLLDRNMGCAGEVGTIVAGQFPPRRAAEDFDPEVMRAWLTETSRRSAVNINATTRTELDSVDDPDVVLDRLAGQRMLSIAVAMVATAANFGARDAAEASGAGMKIWATNSGNSRSSHAALSGETVGIRESFSNGMRQPGDPSGGADENANCMCSLIFV